MREGVINRKTNETDIRLKLELDGSGKSSIDTGCGFLDHMLTLFARHGRFDLTVSCKGDTEVDYHRGHRHRARRRLRGGARRSAGRDPLRQLPATDG